MDSLTKIYKKPIIYQNHKSNKFICLLEWLETKLQLTDCCHDLLKEVNYINLLLQNTLMIFTIKI